MTIDTSNLMTEPFDEEAYFDENIAPLLTKAHELCHERKIPFVAFTAYKHNGAADFGVNVCVSMPGPARTPVTFRIAECAVRKPLDYTARLAAALAGEYTHKSEVSGPAQLIA